MGAEKGRRADGMFRNSIGSLVATSALLAFLPCGCITSGTVAREVRPPSPVLGYLTSEAARFESTGRAGGPAADGVSRAEPAGIGAGEDGGGPTEGLPASPDRDAVRQELDGARRAVGDCAGPGVGAVPVAMEIEGSSGRVASVEVGGDLPHAAADCVREVVLGLQFPQFTNPSLAVS